MMAPALRPIPQPPGHGIGIALPGTNTTVTSSGPASARPLSSTQQLQIPSASPPQGAIALDQVSQMMGDMLAHFRVDMLNRVTNIVESRSSPGPRVPHMSPNFSHHPHGNDSYHEQSSPHFRGSSPSYPSPDDCKDSIKMSKAFKMIKDASKAELYGNKSGPVLYRS